MAARGEQAQLQAELKGVTSERDQLRTRNIRLEATSLLEKLARRQKSDPEVQDASAARLKNEVVVHKYQAKLKERDAELETALKQQQRLQAGAEKVQAQVECLRAQLKEALENSEHERRDWEDQLRAEQDMHMAGLVAENQREREKLLRKCDTIRAQQMKEGRRLGFAVQVLEACTTALNCDCQGDVLKWAKSNDLGGAVMAKVGALAEAKKKFHAERRNLEKKAKQGATKAAADSRALRAQVEELQARVNRLQDELAEAFARGDGSSKAVKSLAEVHSPFKETVARDGKRQRADDPAEDIPGGVVVAQGAARQPASLGLEPLSFANKWELLLLYFDARLASNKKHSNKKPSRLHFQLKRCSVVQDVLVRARTIQGFDIMLGTAAHFSNEQGVDQGGLTTELYTRFGEGLIEEEAQFTNPKGKGAQSPNPKGDRGQPSNAEGEGGQLPKPMGGARKRALFVKLDSDASTSLFVGPGLEGVEGVQLLEEYTDKELKDYNSLGKVMCKCLTEVVHGDQQLLPSKVASSLLLDLLMGKGVAQNSGNGLIPLPYLLDDIRELWGDEHFLVKMMAPAYSLEGFTWGIATAQDEDKRPVKQQQKESFIREFMQVHLVGPRQAALDAIKQGFGMVPLNPFMAMFTRTERRFLISGREDFTGQDVWNCMEINDPGKAPATSTSLQLLQQLVVHQYGHEELRGFLRFITGRPTLPDETQDFQIKVVASLASADHLPVAHTCTKELELPPYDTIEQLREKVGLAVQEGQHFGLA